MYDLVIKNGKIIDGSGSPSFFADVAIENGKIVRIKKGLSGKKTIDAKGLCVTPGFVDSHSHADDQIFTRPDMIEKIEQGITTQIGGQCGGSITPMPNYTDKSKCKEIEGLGNEFDIQNRPKDFFKAVKGWKQGCSCAVLIGHGTIRRHVMGMDNRAPTAEELEKMKDVLREGMESGALGMSFGLYYAPGSYASKEEAVEMAKVVAEYNGVIAAHMRDESVKLAEATKEYIDIARQAGVRAVISHHKACGSYENWGKVSSTLRMIDEANAEGLEIYCDVYPYNATHSSLSATYLPNEDLAYGTKKLVEMLKTPEYRQRVRDFNMSHWWKDDLSWAQLTNVPAYPEYRGLRVNEAAKLHGKDQLDTVMDIMMNSDMGGSSCFFTICEPDIETVMAHPRAMICTDAAVVGNNKVFHPRLKGTFPRVLGRYVRERKVTSLPEMIRKMCYMPAQVYGLRGKGLIAEGFDADICIFDENKIIDRSEFTNCDQRAEGLNYVLVAGEVVVENAVYNGKKMGKVLLFND